MKLILETEEEIKKYTSLISENEALLNRLDELENKILESVYKPGDNDTGGDFHKDIKDIDDVSNNYDENLYSHARELANYYRKNSPDGWVKNLNSRINDITGDYEIRKGLSNDAYKRLIASVRSLCRMSELWGYQEIDKRYEK